MTEVLLTHLIFVICSNSIDNNLNKSHKFDNVANEAKIACFEDLTNCSVGPNGQILSLMDFKRKCIK